MEQPEGTLPLAGLKVLDLSNLYAGPMVSTLLGDFGASVIKAEHPRGDDARRWGLSKDGVPLWWKVLSRNKKLVRMNLNEEADREVVLSLVREADVVIENYRPGRMESWGLGYEDLAAVNPALIMLRVTGFGQDGPMSSQPGFGTLAEAFSGFAYITGQPDGPPTLPPFGLADGVAALTGTYAVMMALYWRDARRGERGQFIDLSLYEPLFTILGPQVIEYTQTGVMQERHGNRSPRTAPRNAYETSDRHWVTMSAGTQEIANRIFAAIESPELSTDPRFSSPSARILHADEVDVLVATWVAEHTLDEVLERFREANAPIAPVYDVSQIMEDEHYRFRQSVVSIPDEDLGEVWMQNVLPRLSLTPGRIRHPGRLHIGHDQEQVVGEHNEWPMDE